VVVRDDEERHHEERLARTGDEARQAQRRPEARQAQQDRGQAQRGGALAEGRDAHMGESREEQVLVVVGVLREDLTQGQAHEVDEREDLVDP
jgi:hypothetical protein